jgi:hypothetical protein
MNMPMRLVSIYWFHFLVLTSTVCMWMDGWMDDTHYGQVQPVKPTNNGHRHTSCCVDPAPLEPVNPVNQRVIDTPVVGWNWSH